MPGREGAPVEKAEVCGSHRDLPSFGEERMGSFKAGEMLWEDQEEPFLQQLFCMNRALVSGKGQLPAAEMCVPEDMLGKGDLKTPWFLTAWGLSLHCRPPGCPACVLSSPGGVEVLRHD